MRSLPFLAAAGGAWAARRALRAAARGRRRVSFHGRHVLITGGSRGLGLVLARQLAAEGARLTLLARTADDLGRAADELRRECGAAVLALPCDVRDARTVEAAVGDAVAFHGRLDAVLHVAGVIQMGPFEHLSDADFAESLGVHFWGARHLTEAALPHLPDDGSGRAAYVSSVAGRVAVPHLAAYSVGKHALAAYADAARAPLAARGVLATTVTPGLMRTGSPPNAVLKGDHDAEYAWLAGADAWLSVSAEAAAARILDAVRHGDAVVAPTLHASAAAAAQALAPRAVAAARRAARAVLPAPVGPEGDRRQSGWASFGAAAPSALTAPSDRATVRNNELRGRRPSAVGAR